MNNHYRLAKTTVTIATFTAIFALAVDSCVKSSNQFISPVIDVNRNSLDFIPEEAIGAVSVGPAALDPSVAFSTSSLMLFDSSGRNIGVMEGKGIYSNVILTSKGGLFTASSDAAVYLGPNSHSTYGIDNENIVQSGSVDPNSGTSTIWFNSGMSGNGYTSNYVTMKGSDKFRQGAFDGYVRTSSQCDEDNYVLAQKSIVPSDSGAIAMGFYKIGPDGEISTISEWEEGGGFRPVSTNSICSENGDFFYSLNATDSALSGNQKDGGFALVKIGTLDGSRVVAKLSMEGKEIRVHKGTLTAIGDRLYWVNIDGHVLSASMSGSSEVRAEWEVSDNSAISIFGSTVSVLEYGGIPSFSRLSLLSGAVELGPIELPWLTQYIEEYDNASGAIHKVTSVASLE